MHSDRVITSPDGKVTAVMMSLMKEFDNKRVHHNKNACVYKTVFQVHILEFLKCTMTRET